MCEQKRSDLVEASRRRRRPSPQPATVCQSVNPLLHLLSCPIRGRCLRRRVRQGRTEKIVLRGLFSIEARGRVTGIRFVECKIR